MEHILTTVEELLTEKPFDQITIAEISARAGTAPTAIYARFSDKTALLLGLHERFRERAADKIFEAIADPSRADAPPAEFLAYAVGEFVALFRDHHRLLRSVLMADSPVMYARAAELGVALSTAIAVRLAPRVRPDRLAAFERDIDFAVRTVQALAQQHLIYGPQQPTRFAYPVEEAQIRLTRILQDAADPYLPDVLPE